MEKNHDHMDELWNEAHLFVLRESAHLPAGCAAKSEHTEEMEAAAAEMFRIAIQLGDRDMLAFSLARFDDFVRKGTIPPLSMLKAINNGFCTFRSSGKTSLDEAFGLRNKTRGAPARFFKREWARTNASMVSHWISEGNTLEVAVEKVAEMRSRMAGGNDRCGLSEAQIKRDYLRFRGIIK
ncbi:hypothetical protein [Azonexus sp.]|uniref:hypothetical protein n=1 Tax=Azonexus sp. TaxID=1872668 RepID=UPI0035ADBB64